MANVVQKDVTHFEVFFEGLPDWAIPMCRIVPQFSTDDENDFLTSTIVYDFNYFWEKVDNKNYKLYMRVSGQLYNAEYEEIPLYVDINLWIINNNFRNNVQHQLGS